MKQSSFGSNSMSIERSHNRSDLIEGARGRREMVPDANTNVVSAMVGSGQVEFAPPQLEVTHPAVTEIRAAVPISNLVELHEPEVSNGAVETQIELEPQTDMLAEARRARDAAFLPDPEEEDEPLRVAA